MDLRISIHDENGDRMQYVVVYQDGSDSEGADQIANFIRKNFRIDYDSVANAENLVSVTGADGKEYLVDAGDLNQD